MPMMRTAIYPLVHPPFRLAMPNDAPRLSLLDELDSRQNELLDELDRLNVRIERVLKDCLAWRGGDNAAQPAAT